MQWIQALGEQHELDLEIYRRAHHNQINCSLHYILVPLEVLSFLWILTAACRSIPFVSIATTALGLTMGILSLLVAERHALGFLVFCLHVYCVKVCQRLVHSFGVRRSLVLGSTIWLVAWVLQVGLGHYMFEKRAPNVLRDQISFLSTMTSVIIAWES